ncbi:MAG: STAS domain-containing protein [Clostridia bacterium]|nr:STAS domain-containing protein [Clostridia bacterium]
MKYTYDENKFELNINLDEEIDMNTCNILRTMIDSYILKYKPKELVIDLTNVKFMDSSGIGLLMGRYELVKLINSSITIINPSKSIMRMIELSQVGRYIKMRSGV